MDVWTSLFDIIADDIFTPQYVKRELINTLYVALATSLNVVIKQILKETLAAREAIDICGCNLLSYAIRCLLIAISTI
ncbi:hypothetical protein CGCSCA1_v012760 [Colletotrichum siamense]|nr:hypothetical protein CGCSCA1_v012760 [Colletotrichum siamense]